MPDTSISETDILEHPFRYETQNYFKTFIDTLQKKNTIYLKLTDNAFVNSILQKDVQMLLRSFHKKKTFNLVLKVSLSKKSSYAEFVRGLDMAHLEGIECYAVLDYDFYYINCQ